MPKVLKNLTVTEVSILTGTLQPANGLSVVVKNAGAIEIVAKAEKCVDGLVYCTVMEPNALDTDSETTEPETIRKAAHDFLKNSRTIDENHNHNPLDGVAVVESYIDDAGSWKAVFDVSGNVEMLEKAKKGEITGVSIYGYAQKVEKAGKEFSAKNKSVLKQAWDLITGLLDKPEADTTVEKSFTAEVAMNDMWRLTNTLETVLRKTLTDDTVTDKESAIIKDIAEFQAYILKNMPTAAEIKKNTKNKSEEPEMTKDELKAMLADIAKDDANNAEAVAKAAKQTELEATVKTLTETVEKQAKTIEELAKSRTTETETDSGEITLESIMKCDDPAKRQEIYNKFVEKNRKVR